MPTAVAAAYSFTCVAGSAGAGGSLVKSIANGSWVWVGGAQPSCAACASGSYSAANASVCSTCAPGFYAAGSGNTACTSCPWSAQSLAHATLAYGALNGTQWPTIFSCLPGYYGAPAVINCDATLDVQLVVYMRCVRREQLQLRRLGRVLAVPR